MSLDKLYSRIVVTVDEVEAQIKPLLDDRLEDRHTSFYQGRSDAGHFSQGDIVRLPGLRQWSVNSNNGATEEERVDYGIIVSNSCDTEPGREDFISILPITPLLPPSDHTFSNDQERNRYTQHFRSVVNYDNSTYFYVPPAPAVTGGTPWDGMWGAFQQIQPYRSSEMQDQLRQDPSIVMASMRLSAYYLLLLKLTVHFMRPDDRFIQTASVVPSKMSVAEKVITIRKIIGKTAEQLVGVIFKK